MGPEYSGIKLANRLRSTPIMIKDYKYKMEDFKIKKSINQDENQIQEEMSTKINNLLVNISIITCILIIKGFIHLTG